MLAQVVQIGDSFTVIFRGSDTTGSNDANALVRSFTLSHLHLPWDQDEQKRFYQS